MSSATCHESHFWSLAILFWKYCTRTLLWDSIFIYFNELGKKYFWSDFYKCPTVPLWGFLAKFGKLLSVIYLKYFNDLHIRQKLQLSLFYWLQIQYYMPKIEYMKIHLSDECFRNPANAKQILLKIHFFIFFICFMFYL